MLSGKSAKLWQFLQTSKDDVELPDTARRFIFDLTDTKEKSVDPNNFWLQWRIEPRIDLLNLPNVEEKCSQVMDTLGYTKLKSWDKVSDLSNKAIEDVNCEKLNC